MGTCMVHISTPVVLKVLGHNIVITPVVGFSYNTACWYRVLSQPPGEHTSQSPSHRHHNANTLLESDVTRRDHVVHCHGSQECWFTLCQFRFQFYSRRHSLRITLKSTTLVPMRSRYAWTRKSWQRSEWRLDFNSVFTSQMTFAFSQVPFIHLGGEQQCG